MLAITVAALLSAAPGTPSALAQGGTPVDNGSFQLDVDGRPIGTETFAIRRHGAGLTAVARVELDAAVDPFASLEVGLETDADFQPVRYELRPQDPAMGRTIVTRTGERLRLATSTPEGERVVEFRASPATFILEPGVAHHYYFPVAWVRAGRPGGSGRTYALIPLTRRREPLEIREAGSATVNVGGESHPAMRYELSVGGERRLVWADADGRILRVEVPGTGWIAARSSAP